MSSEKAEVIISQQKEGIVEMIEKAKPLTAEELQALPNFPQVHKDAIEKAIGEFILDEPEDKVWPLYFRGEMVQCQMGCEINENDELEDGEYDTECVWFMGGWKAKENQHN